MKAALFLFLAAVLIRRVLCVRVIARSYPRAVLANALTLLADVISLGMLILAGLLFLQAVI